jgi:hypothetical protein
VRCAALQFAVVLPLTFLLNEAFRRRELALSNLAQMKARRGNGGRGVGRASYEFLRAAATPRAHAASQQHDARRLTGFHAAAD